MASSKVVGSSGGSSVVVTPSINYTIAGVIKYVIILIRRERVIASSPRTAGFNGAVSRTAAATLRIDRISRWDPRCSTGLACLSEWTAASRR